MYVCLTLRERHTNVLYYFAVLTIRLGNLNFEFLFSVAMASSGLVVAPQVVVGVSCLPGQTVWMGAHGAFSQLA